MAVHAGPAVLERRLMMTLIAALSSGVALSPRLWLSSSRTYPLSPVADWLPSLPFPRDAVWLALMAAALCAALVGREARRSLGMFVVMASLLALCDQTRWQPWFIEYLLMLAALAVLAGASECGESSTGSGVCRLVVAAVYFWSGAHKLNLAFSASTLPGLVTAAGAPLTSAVREALVHVGWIVPVVEMGIGLALLSSRTAGVAATLSIATHLTVLALLIPAHHNSVVWPWNLAMAVFCVLFWRDREFSLRRLTAGLRWDVQLAVIAVLVVMPGLGWAGYWDAYPSFSIYSGRSRMALLQFDETARRQLPARIARLAETEASGRYLLPLDRWAYAELNVPAYPEARVARDVARSLCAGLSAPGELRLEVLEPPSRLSRDQSFSFFRCRELRAGSLMSDRRTP